MKRAGFVVLVAMVLGCGGPGARVVVEPRKVDASSDSPSVSRVTDLGDMGAIPGIGTQLPKPDSDGVYVVGELVLIEGDDFGKLPTVNIGGRPAQSLARTGNGGIITRIPPGVPTGNIEVEVSNTSGRGAKAIAIKRYGFVAGAGQVQVLSFDANGKASLENTLDIAGANDVAYSYDGSVAYVVADAYGKERYAGLHVVSATSSGGPKVITRVRLSGREAAFVATAVEAPIAVVAGVENGEPVITPIDIADPRSPAKYDAWRPKKKLQPLTSLAVHRDGKLAVFSTQDGNLAYPLNLSDPSAPRLGTALDLLPDQRMSMIRDLDFAPGGSELWAVAGDNQDTLVAGAHPARIIRVTVDGTSIARQGDAEINRVEGPVALAVAKRESIMSATAIRSTAKRAVIVVSSVSLEQLAALRGAQSGEPPPQMAFGHLVRTDLEGKGDPIWSSEAYPSGVALSHDVRWSASPVYSVVRKGGALSFELGLAVSPLGSGDGKPSYLRLGDANPPWGDKDGEGGWVARGIALAP